MRLRLSAIVVALLAGLGIATPALASTGGTDDGNLHPNVAMILGYGSDGVRFFCSATLVRKDVLLTAGHCTDGVVGQLLVTFDSVIAEQAPAPFPDAADPMSGYTQQEIERAGYASGTAYTYPAYSHLTDVKNWNDVGVVQLARPVNGITPATIAPVGTLDQIKSADLTKTLFTAVGYGNEVRKPDSGPQKATPMTFPLLRRYVDMPGAKLTSQILYTNNNPNDNQGTGGTCTGDSGGPLFLDGQVVAVTSFGNNDKCRGGGGNQRVDLQGVQAWLATFGV